MGRLHFTLGASFGVTSENHLSVRVGIVPSDIKRSCRMHQEQCL